MATKMTTGRCARGFTLVELMVGMVIGLLVTIIIMQVLSVAEGQKRTSTSGSDAQVNGSLALYALQRDLRMAGYGMSSTTGGLGCTVKAQYTASSGTTSSPTWILAPVQITDGVNGAPDTIEIMSSAKNSYAVPTQVVQDHPATAANFFVDSTLGIAVGDLMIAVPQPSVPCTGSNAATCNWCSVFNVTNVGGQGSGNSSGAGQGLNQVIHNSGNSGPWNQPGGQTIFPSTGYPAGSYLIDLGQMVDHLYSVSNANALQLTTFVSTNATSSTADLYPQIVNLQAMYGKDTNGDGVVDTYDNVTPTDWTQVLTVRVALVARSGQYEKDVVTSANPLWDVGTATTVSGATTCGTSKCLTLKVDGLTDWQHYRYKVFDTVVPLRNLLWRS